MPGSTGLRNSERYGFIYHHGCQCLIASLEAAGIPAKKYEYKGRMKSTPEAKVSMTDEPNGCTIGLLNGYELNDTVCISMSRMLAGTEDFNKKKPDDKQTNIMLFFIDSQEGKIYGVSLNKLRGTDDLMQQIWEKETDPMARRELAKTNWEYFLNLPKQIRDRAEQERAAHENFDKYGIRSSATSNLVDKSGMEATASVMDGLRLKGRADLILEIPHSALCTYIDELNKIPLGIR